MTFDQVVGVVIVGNRFVAAIRSVGVGRIVTVAVMTVRAVRRIPLAYLKLMFIHVAFVRMMKVAVVQEVNVTVMLDGCVATIASVLVRMVLVNRVLFGHGLDLSVLLRRSSVVVVFF